MNVVPSFLDDIRRIFLGECVFLRERNEGCLSETSIQLSSCMFVVFENVVVVAMISSSHRQTSLPQWHIPRGEPWLTSIHAMIPSRILSYDGIIIPPSCTVPSKWSAEWYVSCISCFFAPIITLGTKIFPRKTQSPNYTARVQLYP